MYLQNTQVTNRIYILLKYTQNIQQDRTYFDAKNKITVIKHMFLYYKRNELSVSRLSLDICKLIQI